MFILIQNFNENTNKNEMIINYYIPIINLNLLFEAKMYNKNLNLAEKIKNDTDDNINLRAGFPNLIKSFVWDYDTHEVN